MADNDPKKKKEEPKLPAELANFMSQSDGPTTPISQPRHITAWPSSSASFDVTLQSSPAGETNVQAFWEFIRLSTDAISFNNFNTYMDQVMCKPTGEGPLAKAISDFQNAPRIGGVDAYNLLRLATEAFLITKSGSLADSDFFKNRDPELPRFGGKSPGDLRENLTKYLGGEKSLPLPYIEVITRHLIDDAADTNDTPFFCGDIDQKILQPFFIELIWSYWHEEAGLVQAINAISLRFQNKRSSGDHDPLANLETHPLRPLANLLWGYVQDDDHRLTVARRAYEYEHEYGLSLLGRAVPKLLPADRRSKFLESFHTLLHQAAIYYDRSSNLTVRADAFPLLNALREVHLVLAEGAHNQFRELPWTARVEMLIQQWLLARREVREFVAGRPAVPYPEEWMRSVDALRRLMGWGDTAVTHFTDLAAAGEKILLAVRFANWSDSSKVTDNDASGWAVFWKPEIQRYIHAYQAVTGVDLSATTTQSNRQIDATPPSVLLQQRIARQQRG